MLTKAMLSLAVLLLLVGGAMVRAETPDPMCPGSTLERQAALAAAAPPLWQIAQKQRGLCFIDRDKVPIATSAVKPEEK